MWDPAWGTGNLTRDYKFKELYVSTLNQSDIDTANQMGYNSEAVKFQFDFLNDPDDKLPQGLRTAIESGREIIVFMNPPYGRSNEGGKISTVQKTATFTKTTIEMKKEKWGECSAQLYAQFLFKIFKLNKILNINICIFSPPLLYVGDSFKEFRKKFFEKYQFDSGFLLNSSNFADVKEWALTFSIIKNKKNV